jgi:hypothetical protein
MLTFLSLVHSSFAEADFPFTPSYYLSLRRSPRRSVLPPPLQLLIILFLVVVRSEDFRVMLIPLE